MTYLPIYSENICFTSCVGYRQDWCITWIQFCIRTWHLSITTVRHLDLAPLLESCGFYFVYCCGSLWLTLSRVASLEPLLILCDTTRNLLKGKIDDNWLHHWLNQEYAARDALLSASCSATLLQWDADRGDTIYYHDQSISWGRGLILTPWDGFSYSSMIDSFHELIVCITRISTILLLWHCIKGCSADRWVHLICSA